MRLPRTFAALTALALGGGLAGCGYKGSDPSSAEAGANEPALYIAAAQLPADAGGATLLLSVSAPAGAAGVIVCEHAQRLDCEAGRGRFLTADPQRLAGDRRIFLANMPAAVANGKVLTAVAHDAGGSPVGSTLFMTADRAGGNP